MKVITLNTWGGLAGKEGILAFFEAYKDTTDIFCLQEIWSAPYKELEDDLVGGRRLKNDQVMVYGMQEISATLPDHVGYFRPHLKEHYGLMMLVNKNILVQNEGERFVYKERGFVGEDDIGNHARNIQYADLRTDSGPLTVINLHGLWTGKGKTDTEDRILQSKNIVDFISGVKGEVILCGDFNLLPDTESIKIIEDAGLRNLIKEYGVTSTRTSHYTKPEKYADYVFVSGGVEVKDFQVLPDEVSDHNALFLEVAD